MKVRPRYMHWIPRVIGVEAITLYPYVLFTMAKDEAVHRFIVQHECVHVRQVRELGWLTFYARYVGQWFLGLFKSGSAYEGITFEKEAYAQQRTIMMTLVEKEEFDIL